MSQEMNPFDELMNSVENTSGAINPDKDVEDAIGGAGARAFDVVDEEADAPIEVSQTEIKKMLEDLDAKTTQILFENTENFKLEKLLAKAPNLARWVTEEMNITELECTKGPQECLNKKYPVKMPERPNQTIDGYLIDMNGTPLHLAKSNAVEWLLNNTIGRVAGGNEGKELHVVETNSRSLSKKKLPFKPVAYGLSAYEPNDVIDTFEPDFEADGTPKTTTRLVTLNGGKDYIGADNKKIPLRGTVENFPVFRRKEMYRDGLGTINQRSLNRGVPKGAQDQKVALEKYAEILVKVRKAQAVE